MTTNESVIAFIKTAVNQPSLQPIPENTQLALLRGRPRPGGYLEYMCLMHHMVITDACQILEFPRDTAEQQRFFSAYLKPIVLTVSLPSPIRMTPAGARTLTCSYCACARMRHVRSTPLMSFASPKRPKNQHNLFSTRPGTNTSDTTNVGCQGLHYTYGSCGDSRG